MKIEKIITAALMTPGERGNWGLPLLFWGPPGVAKSDRIEAAARACGLPCEVLSPGERGEAAFGVIPVPREVEVTEEDQDTGETRKVKRFVIDSPQPSWTLRFEDSDGAGCVFIDECVQTPPAIQPALLGAIHARRIGAHFLGKRVRVLAAANPVAIGGGYDLPAPVANRLGHFDWPMPSVDEWVQWLTMAGSDKEKFGDAAKEEARVEAAWGSAFAWSKGIVGSFLRARRVPTSDKEFGGQTFLHGMPRKSTDPNLSKAWRSPRTWALATRALAGSRIHGLDDEEQAALVGSFVGEGAAVELFAYMRSADLPMPEDVLDGKVKLDHDPMRLDRTMAVLSSCAAFVAPPNAPKRNERAGKLWEIIGGLLGQADDLVVLTIYTLTNAKLHQIKEAVPVLLKARPVLTAAGIGRGAR